MRWFLLILISVGAVATFMHFSGLKGNSAAGSSQSAPPEGELLLPRTDPPGGAILAGAHFVAKPVVSVYLRKSSPLSDRWSFVLSGMEKGDHVSFRVFAPDDNLLVREHWDTAVDSPETVLGEMELAEISTANPSSKGLEEKAIGLDVIEPGEYVIRLVSGLSKTTLQAHVPGADAYGISFQNGVFQPWKRDLTSAFFYVPENAVEITLAGRGIRILDDLGNEIYPAGVKPSEKAEISISRTKVVWTVEFEAADWEFRAAGFPVILGEDRAYIESLQASQLQTPSGALVPHQFQVRAEAAIRELLAPENVGDTAELLALIDAEPEEWTRKDLEDARALRGSYGLIPHLQIALSEQLLDPDHHWAGTIGKEVWESRLAANSPDTRWDYLRHTPGRNGQGYGGLSTHAYAPSLVQAYSLDRVFNQLHGRKELLYRAAAVALRDLMSVNEEGVLAGSGADMSSYSGFPSFVFGFRHFQEFAIAAPHMPPHIRKVWAEGLRHLVDRYWPEGLVSTRNQSSHYLGAFQYFAMGSDDPIDQKLAESFARRFIAGLSPVGYPAEAGGPCSSYAGISHHYMSKYWANSGDESMRDAINKSYDFYNHTAAREPSGRALAGYNFTHRVPTGFHAEQYGGARPLSWKDLDAATSWNIAAKREAGDLEEPWTPGIPAEVARLPQVTYHAVAYTKNETPSGALPSDSAIPFIKNLGDELIAVKRPAYYAAFYVGKPAPSPYYLYGTAAGIQPWPDKGDSNGGSMADLNKIKQTRRPFNNGGITIFQTPEFGSAILGAPVPFAHHGIVASKNGDLLHAEDYFASEFSLDEEAGTLMCSGKLDSLPLQYRRTYAFDDDHLNVSLRVFASEALDLQKISEVIPLVGGPAKENGTKIQLLLEGNPLDESKGVADEVRVLDSAGNGIQIRFAEPVSLDACETGPTSQGGIVHNRVEVQLPSDWRKGQLFSLAYQIVPVSKSGLAQ